MLMIWISALLLSFVYIAPMESFLLGSTWRYQQHNTLRALRIQSVVVPTQQNLRQYEKLLRESVHSKTIVRWYLTNLNPNSAEIEAVICDEEPTGSKGYKKGNFSHE